MDDYETLRCMYEDSSSRMKVLLAHRKQRPGLFVLKKYECIGLEEAELLVKRGIRIAKDSLSPYVTLTDLFLSGNTNPTVTLEFECYMSEPPHWFITKNDRGREKTHHNRYLVLKPLHENPITGVKVFEAIDLDTHTDVIVKESPRFSKWQSVNGFLREAVVQAIATHERTVELLDVKLLPIPFSKSFKAQIVMEALDHDLRSELSGRGEPYTENELLKFLFQVTSGLLHIKSKVSCTQNIAHRDIKPANVFIDCGGDMKVGDFGSAWMKHMPKLKPKDMVPIAAGLAAPLDREQLTHTRSCGGTPQYMSPEMRSVVIGRSQIDPFASDIFSLGLTFLCMAKLHVPEGAISTDIDSLVRYLDIEVNSIAYSARMKRLMRRMLSVDSSRRPVLEEVHIAAADGFGRYQEVESRKCDCMNALQLAVEEAKWKTQLHCIQMGTHSQADIIKTYVNLAQVHCAQNRKTAAKENAEDALKLLELQSSEFYPGLAAIYLLLANIYHDARNFKVAYEHAFKAFGLMQGKLQRSEGYRIIAEIYLSNAHHREAEEYVKKAIEVHESQDDLQEVPALPLQEEKPDAGEHHEIVPLDPPRFHFFKDCKDVCISGSDAPDNLRHEAALYTTLADVYDAVGRFKEAREHAEWALDALETVLSPRHPELATSYYVLAKICFDQRDLDTANEYVLKALDIRLQSFGEVHPGTAKCYALLSAIELELGMEVFAKQHIRKALAIGLLTQGELHPSTAAAYAQLALVYVHCSKLHKALLFAEKARLAQLDILGDQHPAIINTYFVLSRVHRSMKCLKEAEEFGGEAVRISEQILGLKHPLTEIVESHLSSIRADRIPVFTSEVDKELVAIKGEKHLLKTAKPLALESARDSDSTEKEATLQIPIALNEDNELMHPTHEASERHSSIDLKKGILPCDWKGVGPPRS